MEYKKQTKTKKSCDMVVYHIIKFYLKRKNKTITRIVSLAYHVKIYKKNVVIDVKMRERLEETFERVKGHY